MLEVRQSEEVPRAALAPLSARAPDVLELADVLGRHAKVRARTGCGVAQDYNESELCGRLVAVDSSHRIRHPGIRRVARREVDEVPVRRRLAALGPRPTPRRPSQTSVSC